ncbi:MAG: molecular chaperone [Klebsiella huaxiensis]|uniref:fimbrial biogenesis chaperone n=1 Tax=Klebsiella huaxiensis TaxID=2153354 RepID=UPI0026F0195A|nr:molecular chaperone [Klebsiella huaxiensis]WEJ89519.1 MAG: molecular chaperone [Klebsiella huaxiensis]
MGKTILIILMLLTPISYAGMLIEKTRVIYHEGEVTQSVNIMNVNPYPTFVQTWVDLGEVNNFKQSASSPFVLIPPIFNLRPNEIKSVRVIFNGQKLPTDRESLYWINIYEVPAIKEAPGIDKYLLMSMKTQLKLIYRPKNLTGNVNDAGNSVSCSLKQDNHLSLTCRNNSGYVLSYNDIIVNIQGKYYKASADLDLMIKPFSESFFSLIPISVEPIKTSGSIIFKLINDKGEIEEIKKTLPTI